MRHKCRDERSKNFSLQDRTEENLEQFRITRTIGHDMPSYLVNREEYGVLLPPKEGSKLAFPLDFPPSGERKPGCYHPEVERY